MCEQLRKRKVYMCYQQEVRSRGKDLNLLVSNIGDLSCGGLEIIME